MNVSKVDPFTGKSNTYNLNITSEQYQKWINGELIQNAMPNLTADEREFLISGTAIGTFDDRFPEDDEDDDELDYLPDAFGDDEDSDYRNDDNYRSINDPLYYEDDSDFIL